MNRLTYPEREIAVCDNSKDEKYCEKLYAYGITVMRNGRTDLAAVPSLCFSQNILREYFLSGPWSHMMMIECDVFPPLNVIEYLLLYNVPVISLTYFTNSGREENLVLQGMTMTKGRPYQFNLSQAMTFHLFNGRTQSMEQWGDQSWQLIGCGLGCTLIHRSVLEKVNFRVDKSNRHTFADTNFHQDCAKVGISNWIDTTTICFHDNQTSWHANTDYRRKN